MVTNSINQYRGIYGIPATPFNEDETLDVRSLESVLNFSVENGCHGIVMPVMASEYQSLTDVERRKIFDVTTKSLTAGFQLLLELPEFRISTLSNLQNMLRMQALIQ